MRLTKSSFRNKCIKKMQKAAKENRIYKAALLNRKLLEIISNWNKSDKELKILFYYPLKNEANIIKSLKILRKKHKIYIPFMEGSSFKMVPFRLPLQKKRFGILEAGNTIQNINKIDIAIVPVVGVDGNFQRVGYGKGMYDRFFETLQQKPYTIFVQAELCFTQQTLCDSHDISCDLLITPTKIIENRSL
ncbi:5-formyltetrahydrofolate cyclo-ligase [hydrothermal vent metagenome]|uniref:5-formyltetrahydrofolate cyclo-ligase n=1 Tax=hydrothermal vent metagenome TaxID=652676 RepID=A0A1W1CGE7_9ZZZZ